MRLITVAPHAWFALTIPPAGGDPPPRGGGSGAFLFPPVIRAASRSALPGRIGDQSADRRCRRRWHWWHRSAPLGADRCGRRSQGPADPDIRANGVLPCRLEPGDVSGEPVDALAHGGEAARYRRELI